MKCITSALLKMSPGAGVLGICAFTLSPAVVASATKDCLFPAM